MIRGVAVHGHGSVDVRTVVTERRHVHGSVNVGTVEIHVEIGEMCRGLVR